MSESQYSNNAPVPDFSFPEVCSICGQALKVGDIIRFNHAAGTAAHESCLKEKQDE